MSLAGRKKRLGFWGTLTPVVIVVILMAVAAYFSVWNVVEKLAQPVYKDWRFYAQAIPTLAAVVLAGLDRHFAGKRAKSDAAAVSDEAFEVLKDLATAMGRLTGDEQFKDYFNDLVQKCGPKLFRERKVRIGFFVLEAGESEKPDELDYLKKRAAFDLTNGMPLDYRTGTLDADDRDQAKEMIVRTKASKDLHVKNIYKDSADWQKLVKVKKHAYKCFVSAPVLDSSEEKPLGLLTVDAPKVGDLTDVDREWVRVLAKMLSHGLRDETSVVPKPANPLVNPAAGKRRGHSTQQAGATS